MTYRLGVDVGGTFTDMLLIDEDTGATYRAKTSSTPEDQSVGVLRRHRPGLRAAGIEPRRRSATSCTARRWPPTRSWRARAPASAWSTTDGLPPGAADRPVVRPGRPGRLDHLAQARAPGRAGGHRRGARSASPATARSSPSSTRTTSARQLRAPGRARDRGAEHQPDQLLRQRRPTSERVARARRRGAPRLRRSRCPRRSFPSCGSTSGRSPRSPTPTCSRRSARYVANLEAQLRDSGVSGTLSILRSDGGLVSARAAADNPVSCCCPARRAASPARRGSPRRPGTATSSPSTWAAPPPTSRWSQDLTPRIGRETTVGDLKVRATSVDVRTVGAGGGSIAHVPQLTQALRVGPAVRRRRARPGGVRRRRHRADGHRRQRGARAPAQRARRRRDHARPRGGPHRRRRPSRTPRAWTSVEAAAAGIIDIVNENMFGALRLVSVQQGFDPRDFALVAFGGAGPLHANALGTAHRVLAGHHPALARRALRLRRRDHQPARRGGAHPGPSLRRAHRRRAARHPRRPRGVGAAARSSPRASPEDDQQPELLGRPALPRPGLRDPRRPSTSTPSTAPGAGSRRSARRSTPSTTGCSPSCSTPSTSWSRSARPPTRPRPDVGSVELEDGGSDASPARVQQHRIWSDGGLVDADVYDRSLLSAGNVVTGPAVITEMDSTTLVLRDHAATVHPSGSLLIRPVDRSQEG